MCAGAAAQGLHLVAGAAIVSVLLQHGPLPTPQSSLPLAASAGALLLRQPRLAATAVAALQPAAAFWDLLLRVRCQLHRLLLLLQQQQQLPLLDYR